MTREEFQIEIGKLEKESKNSHKLELCGQWAYGTSPTTGNLMSIQFRCKDYKLCDECLDITVQEEEGRISRAIVEVKAQELYVRKIPAELWTATVKRWRRKGLKYRAYPQLNADVPYYYTILTEPEDSDWVPLPKNEDGWIELPHLHTILRSVPEGKRRSGKLGYLPPLEPEPDTELISVEMIIHNAGSDTRVAAWSAAKELTADLNPHTSQEVEQACQERTEVFKEELKARGASILHTRREKRRVRLSSIEWVVDGIIRPSQTPLTRETFQGMAVLTPIVIPLPT